MRRILTGALVLAAVAAARPAPAQTPLAVARTLYASARYDESLEALDRLRFDSSSPRADALTVEKYRALCLLALGRENEAESAFAGVVAVDPMYLPDAREVSPSVRAFFRDVRRRMLPGIARARYVEARSAYDRGEYGDAATRFGELGALLADADREAGQDDLRLLASGFEELSRAKAEAALAVAVAARAPDPPPEPPAPDPVPPPSPEPDVYGPDSPGVTPPVVVRQDLPSLSAEARLLGRPRGLLEVLIDEQGRVAAVVLREPIHVTYDRRLIEAATHWRYEPARVGGQPVKYRKVIEVTVR